MSDPRADALRDAAAARSQDAEERARSAIRALRGRGIAVNFTTVAQTANVGRDFLYRHTQLRDAIEQLRGKQQRAPSRVPAHEQASEESTRTRLRGAIEENKRLRAENAQLREELALALGQVRELELTHRRASTT